MTDLSRQYRDGYVCGASQQWSKWVSLSSIQLTTLAGDGAHAWNVQSQVTWIERPINMLVDIAVLSGSDLE